MGETCVSSGAIVFVFASSAFMSKRSDRKMSVLLILLFNSCTLIRFLEGGDFVRALSVTFLHAFTGLAGAEDDFFGDFLFGDMFEPRDKFKLFEVRLLLLDLVETPGENAVGLLRPDLGLFLLEMLLRMPFSKDLRAESKTSLKSRLHCPSVFSLVFAVLRVFPSVVEAEALDEVVRLRVCFWFVKGEFGRCVELVDIEVALVRPVIMLLFVYYIQSRSLNVFLFSIHTEFPEILSKSTGYNE